MSWDERCALADLLEGRAAPDALAAEAYELFGRSVFPFAGVFLDPEVSSMEPLADSLRAEPLSSALWTWVPAFCCAVRDLASPLGEDVTRRLDLLLDALPSAPSPPAPPPPDLDDPDTDLRALITFLAAPVRCGMFLSAPVLERIGRETGVPRGFGPRARLLRELLLGASRYEQLPVVLGSLRQVAEQHRARLAVYARSEAIDPWLQRLEATCALLTAMEARLGSRRDAG